MASRISLVNRFGAMLATTAFAVFTATLFADELLIADFDSAAVGSYNPREDWTAFGNGTTDRGVTASGSTGRGAFHSVLWDDSSWGIGNKELARDLSAYDGVRVDARIVSGTGHTGTALLRMGMNMTDGSEWSTPTVPITGDFTEYQFLFSSLTLRSGSGPLDLANAQIKFIVEKNGQAGRARFDFDEVVAFTTNGPAPYSLTTVELNRPPDGDAVRALWFYPGTIFDTGAASQELLDLCAREGVNRLYCGGYSVWTLGTTTQKENMRTFVETAHASGIRVEAMFGGSDWQEDPQKVRTKIDQVLAMHTATPAHSNDDFDAIHFDVEFWTDDSWDAAADEAARQQIAINYLDNVLVNARTYLDACGESDMDITVDLSAHHENSNHLPNPFFYNGTTQHFIGHVMDYVDDVAVMSYIDYASGLLNWTGFELDIAVAKGRKIQLGADIQPSPPAVPINTFADNSPTGYSSMTVTLESFHTLLTSSRLAALDGFAIFQYTGMINEAPNPYSIADLDGDEDVDLADYDHFAASLLGPGLAVEGLACDDDLDNDGEVTLTDFAILTRCYTGSGVSAVSQECRR